MLTAEPDFATLLSKKFLNIDTAKPKSSPFVEEDSNEDVKPIDTSNAAKESTSSVDSITHRPTQRKFAIATPLRVQRIERILAKRKDLTKS